MKVKKIKIMNYEEKYRQAFERAKERYSACSAPALLEYIFPELKENEDERIRKAIICGMNALKENRKSETFATIPIDDCIAWLEKQREQKTIDNDGPKFHPGDWIIDNEYGEVLKVTKADANSYEITTQDGEALGGILKEDVECNHRLWTFEDAKDGDVLATSAGAFIYNGKRDGISCPGSYCGINTLGRFQIGGERHWTGKKVYPATKEQRDLLFAKMKEAGYEWNCENKELKMIEQKTIDKVESKFHEGDWITDGYIHCKITEILDDRYIIESKYAKRSAILFEHENRYHLWTIKDAKDGDVLSGEIDGDKYIFSFKKLNGRWIETQGVCYCDTTGDCIEDARFCNHYQDFFKPASKEECDILLLKTTNHQWK